MILLLIRVFTKLMAVLLTRTLISCGGGSGDSSSTDDTTNSDTSESTGLLVFYSLINRQIRIFSSP
jgi:hypothetical protein